MIRVLLLCAAALSMQAQSIEGLWSSESDFSPKLRGELTITNSKESCRATLAGQTTSCTQHGDGFDFAFADNTGTFRGKLANGGRSIEGFWIQRPGANDGGPGGPPQGFAVPLTLKRTSSGVWRGTVVPLPQTFTLYIKVYRNAEGVLVGAVRNPEYNMTGNASNYRVTQDGNNVAFALGDDIRMDAKLAGDKLELVWPDSGQPITFTRRTPEQAAKFFPRFGVTKYAYRKPDALDDGWKTSRANDTGLDEAALTKLVQRLIDADPAGRRPSLIHSLLVAHKGKLVLEEYFFGHTRETAHDVRSAGKTFSSILLGALMRNGVRLSPDSRIVEVMKAHGPFANPDPRKSQITLAHLMTHSAGLACNDNDNKSPGNEETLWTQTKEPRFWKYTLDLPMEHDPGTRYAYCSANINLAGAALSEASGTWLPELFDRTIARPLQFGRYHWNVTPLGDGYLGGGAYIRPRDLIKVGQMMLSGGVWNGKRIIDPSWIAESTKARMEVTPATTGLSEENFGNFYGRGTDAYAWHLGSLTSGGHTYSTYAATGNGGQVLIVVPELDLTVLFTGGNYMQGGIWSRWGQQIIGDEIIPALTK